MLVEEIARLAGHSSSRTTEVIYRKELRPVLVKGAEVMDQLRLVDWRSSCAGWLWAMVPAMPAGSGPREMRRLGLEVRTGDYAT